MKHQDALAQLARETARARQSLVLERAVRVGFWFGLAVTVWAVLALAGGHELLPLVLQSLTVVVALIAFAWLGLRARRGWRPPTEGEARARLAADSKLELGAFEALRDQPTRYDPFSVALWRREQEHAFERVERARSRGAKIKLDDIDRFQLRYVAVIALLAAGIYAGDNAGDRLARAFIPDPGPLLGDQPMVVEAWVTPADYTHAAPISLSDRLGERIVTPPTVEATVRVTGPVGAPVLVFDGREDRRTRFTRAADGAWEARMALPGPGRLKIVRFHTRGFWRMQPAPDRNPSAAFVAPLAQMAAENVSVSWRAADDYGVTRVALRVRPLNPPEGLEYAAAIDTEVESPAGDPQRAADESEVDLAAHPYAGMEVEAQIVAFDALGQEGVSSPLRFTLPEKVFLQPLARAAVQIRRHILTERRPYRRAREERRRTIPAGSILLGNERIEIRDYSRRPALNRAPEGIRYAVRLTDALTMEPRDGYFRDMAVFFGFRMARSQLSVAANIDETDVAADTLWRTALRAEYGGPVDARRAMEEAYRALAEALQQRAPPERIRQLVEALRQATDNYMQALVQEALRNGEQQTAEDTQEQASMSQDDVQDLLEDIQRMAEQGQMSEAAAMLAMHQAIMENMELRIDQQQAEGGQQGEQNEQMQESMDQLSEAMGDQRQLNEDTRQENQEGQGGGGGDQEGGQGGAQDLAERQEQIREDVGQAQQQAGSAGAGAAATQNLQEAQRQMQSAEGALSRGDLDAAETAQAAALEALREGAQEMASQMRGQGAQSSQSGQNSGPRDPLGRLMPNAGVGEGDTEIPTQIDPVRAREILDEIRRRAQDANRPESEREYLRRLLDRFGDS